MNCCRTFEINIGPSVETPFRYKIQGYTPLSSGAYPEGPITGSPWFEWDGKWYASNQRGVSPDQISYEARELYSPPGSYVDDNYILMANHTLSSVFIRAGLVGFTKSRLLITAFNPAIEPYAVWYGERDGLDGVIAGVYNRVTPVTIGFDSMDPTDTTPSLTVVAGTEP